MSTLVYTGVRKTFGPTVALEGLDLEIHSGELISLLGPSGCGKTTALRICAGFERPDIGRVSVSGSDITDLPAHRRNMGMVFQSYSLFPNLTVEGNVEYGLRTRKIDRTEARRRVGEMLELVQLSDQSRRYPHQLSGGQQQRVALARALAVQPQVLLLDEPLSALDAKVRVALRDEIRRIQRDLGITTMFVTHDQEEALGISDRIGVMSNGRLEQLGSPVDVYRTPANAFVARFVGTMNELPATVPESGCVDVAGVRMAISAEAAVGSRVNLLVRPEDLSIGDPDGGLVGSVASSTFHGATNMLGVRLDVLDTLVSVSLPGSLAGQHTAGDRVGVTVDAARAILEPAAG